MKVILKKDVPNLGFAGDIKEVKNGYARNFLLPQSLVIKADARSKKELLFLEQVRKQKLTKRQKIAKETSDKLNGTEVRITAKLGEDGKMFGSITNIQVQKELEKSGFIIDKKQIQVEEPIKSLGIYSINVKLHEGVGSVIKLFVQDEHGNTEPVKKAVVEETAPEAEEAEPVAEAVSEETEEEAGSVDDATQEE